MKLSNITSAAVLSASVSPFAYAQEANQPAIQSETQAALVSVLHADGSKSPITLGKTGRSNTENLAEKDKVCFEKQVKIVNPLTVEAGKATPTLLNCELIKDSHCEGGLLTPVAGETFTFFPQGASTESSVYMLGFSGTTVDMYLDQARQVSTLNDQTPYIPLKEPSQPTVVIEPEVIAVSKDDLKEDRYITIGLQGGVSLTKMQPYADVQVGANCISTLHMFQSNARLCLDARLGVGGERTEVNNELGLARQKPVVNDITADARALVGLHVNLSNFSFDAAAGMGYQVSHFGAENGLFKNDDGTDVDLVSTTTYSPKAGVVLDLGYPITDKLSCGLNVDLAGAFTNTKIPEKEPSISPVIKTGVGCNFDIDLQ